MVRRFLQQLRALLALSAQMPAELRAIERALKSTREAVDQTARRSETERRALQEEIATLRNEIRERLLQYHLQLGRMTSLLEPSAPADVLSARIPLEIDAQPAAHVSASAAPAVDTATDRLVLNACPACTTDDRTLVCEWNKLVLLDSAPDEDAWRSDYSVCHGCGILYAARRPIGSRYRYLVDNFEDVIDKDTANPLLNPAPLTPADRDRYRRLIGRGPFVSDHRREEHVKSLFGDRMDLAGHVDLLGSLLDVRGKQVLEIRSRAGTIVAGLRRQFGAEVAAMPIWESQQFVVRELYGIETSDLIDFDRFAIPFERRFDLIICNHMINHAVRLDAFFAVLRAKLLPGGHVYFYNEIDDSEFLEGGQSMIATMNPLHLQATDRASLVRAVEANGFEPVFVKGRHKRNVCLARMTDPSHQWTRIAPDQLRARIAAYQRARDRAVLRMPEPIRARVAGTWSSTVERAVASGLARFDQNGAIRLVKES